MKGKQVKLQDIEKDSSGNYAYKGVIYRFRGDFKAFILKAWALMALVVALVILGGLFPATGAMDTWYVIIPYASTVAASGFMVYRLVIWTGGKGELRSYEFERTARRTEMNLYILIFLAIVTLALEIMHLVVFGLGEYPKGAILLMISMALTAGLGVLTLKHFNKANWENIGDAKGSRNL